MVTGSPVSDLRKEQRPIAPKATPTTVHAPAAPPCWTLSIGVAGMLSQMHGLARAVGRDFVNIETRLRSPWRWFPLSAIPCSPRVIRQHDAIAGDTSPQLVISCGRHSVIPSLWLKQKFGDDVLTVHIQDPTIDPGRFDLVVAPEHDQVRGSNVIETAGALHRISQGVLEEAAQSPAADRLRVDGRPLVSVILGGPNRYYAFPEEDIARLAGRLDQLVRTSGARLAIIGSRRTPASLRERLYNSFGNAHFVWDGESENPYLTALAIADAIVVTGDSVSMVSEAAATGHPVLVEYLSERRRARRFQRFHESFQRRGITRPFEGRLETWSYEPPRDTEAVAQIIRERLSQG
ncbi:MAG: mitochondrial fission ELM1 family protein [Maioricimonas sp. JB045]